MFCKCGCGSVVKKGNSFISGHNTRLRKHSKYSIKKIIESNKKTKLKNRLFNEEKKVTQSLLKKMFKYEKDGSLVRLAKTAPVTVVNKSAGSINKRDGYCRISIRSKLYKRSRLVWLWHHGYIPEEQIDHINKIRHDDRIENLRLISQTCNSRNSSLSKRNKSGVKGIHFDKSRKRWVAYIVISGKNKYLGRFNNFDEAVLHRLAAEQCLDWNGCDSQSPAYKYSIENELVYVNKSPK